MQPHILFCRGAGVLGRGDVERLLTGLQGDPAVIALAKRFGQTLPKMAEYAFDATLVFLRVCIQSSVDERPGVMFAPGPVAHPGWDVLADVPEGTRAWEFYADVCHRLCVVLGVPPVVVRHHKFTTDDGRIAARDQDAVGNVVRAMNDMGLTYVPAHWQTDIDPMDPGDGWPDRGHFNQKLLVA
jgi:hypothetical protein